MRRLIAELLKGPDTTSGGPGRVNEPAPSTASKVFGEPIFSMPSSHTVARSRFGNAVKQCKICDVAVPILGTGIVVTSAMYARLEEKTDGNRIVADPPSKPSTKVVKFTDPAIAQEYQDHVEASVTEWNGAQTAWTAVEKAFEADGNPKAKLATNGKISPFQPRAVAAPRLVGKPELTAQTV